MTTFQKNSISLVAVVLLLAGCSKKLDVFPQNDITADKVFATPQGYDQAMAKVYGSFALTGNQGPAGQPDLPGGGDEGWSDFVRCMWKLQELPTEEAIVTWGDPGLPDFHTMKWSAGNPFTRRMYARALVQVSFVNNFLEEAGKVSSKGFAQEDQTRITYYAAEARFLRAFDYWLLMDLFGNPSFPLKVSADPPSQIQKKELFAWIEKELLAIEPLLMDARSNHQDALYGRADKGACWALLARMYLNAEVYTGTGRYADAATYAKKVIDAGYTLAPEYRNLMVEDNNVVSRSEFILTVNYDAVKTQGYGGTTFMANAANGTKNYNFKAKLPSGDTLVQTINFGTGGWDGLKTTTGLTSKFPNGGLDPLTGRPDNTDTRAQFVGLYTARKTKDRKLDSVLTVVKPSLTSLGSVPTEGLRVWKCRNVTSTGAPGADPGRTFSSTDFPLFRLGEMYLIYAECAARGQADVALGVQYVNNLRERAYKNSNGNITAASLTTDFILDERARELYWEGHRRTDLIRYGKFTSGDYLWPFKGGVADGQGVAPERNLYPIPENELTANPNLVQNPGY